ncbi:MAG: DegV family protein [Anaerolineae bacterium]|nr:DegV family protein [Anaerolineae bacterium]
MVKFIADTTSCLPESFTNQYNIPVIPQVINFGEESFLENLEISYASFMERLQISKSLPKTAAPPPELFLEAYARLASDAEPILCILPSAAMSGTVRSARVGLHMARERGLSGLDVRILDTQLIASPVAALIQMAVMWAEQGDDADTIVSRVLSMSQRGKIYFSVATLKYLAKGGRIGGAAALLGSMLNVKPVLTIVDGKVDVFEKVRTQKRAVERLKQLVLEQIAPGDHGYLSIMHAEAADDADALSTYFHQELGLEDILIYAVPPAVVVHAGPGVLGTAFFTE